MPIELHDAALAHPGHAPVLDSVSLVFSKGWTGIAGPNGAGKSTLLATLAGVLPLRGGRLRVQADGPVLRCAQDTTELADAVRDLAWDPSRRARRLRADLQLDPIALDRWPTLSPGERRRWQLAAVLAAEPGVLLLDEPTAHLDVAASARLMQALRRFDGVGVVVSHDRHLLDALVQQVVWVEGGVARAFAGGYTAAQASRDAESRRTRDALTARQDEARRLKAQLHAAQENAAAAGRARRLRGVNPRDHDARSMGAKLKAEWAIDAHSRRASSTRTALSKAEAGLTDHSVRRDNLARLKVEGGAQAGGVLARFDDAALVPAPEAPPLLFDLDLRLDPGDRVWIAGPNGAGKSTLLRALRARLRVPEGGALWLAQARSAAEDRAALAAVREQSPDLRAATLARLAALGHTPGRVLAAPQPSPGQGRALAVALALGDAAQVLLLDEPEHDLDLPAVGRLEAALAQWPGTLALVTHDRAFARALCTSAWWVAEGRVRTMTVAEAEAATRGLSGAPAAAMV